MRKFGIIFLGLLALVIIGAGYYLFVNGAPTRSTEIPSTPRALTVVIPYHSWSFEPDVIDVDKGTLLALTLINQDDIEHGFAIDEYGINISLPPHATTSIPAFMADKTGDMRFYCSVMCGDGVAETGAHKGTPSGHFDMRGTLRVRELVTPVASSTVKS